MFASRGEPWRAVEGALTARETQGWSLCLQPAARALFSQRKELIFLGDRGWAALLHLSHKICSNVVITRIKAQGRFKCTLSRSVLSGSSLLGAPWYPGDVKAKKIMTLALPLLLTATTLQKSDVELTESFVLVSTNHSPAKWFSYTNIYNFLYIFFFLFIPIMAYHRILTIVPCAV